MQRLNFESDKISFNNAFYLARLAFSHESLSCVLNFFYNSSLVELLLKHACISRIV